MKAVFVFAFCLLLSSVARAQSFADISNERRRVQRKNGIGKGKKDGYNEVRIKLFATSYLSFIDSCDRFFVLETWNIENRMIYGLIWNEKRRVSYSYIRGTFSFDTTPAFSNYMIKLVENWDINGIRTEEKLYGNFPYVYATKVYRTERSPKIDCIMFKDFFKLGRD